ncbi:MAG: TIGR03905 family TSCPD domain-containing protein [Firmicutes bacterium]|nr:TIGR03905 family TSCPD domain-containing protein [Bacillota bacterium]MCM1400667.1 TIGR03905 family TSCPD domain-containing protein [Bacteroides sp.]MCM1476361.1 TIGR03905 family TSCPD domain-containing protein [Bacteroides sp.]
MKHTYKTSGTCSRIIEIDYDTATDTVGEVSFAGGCHGNLQGIGRLVKGMKATDVIDRLEGVKCGVKTTSCPDQLAQALKQIINK